MKSNVNTTSPEKFSPIELVITIETKEELVALRGLWGANYSAAKAVKRDAYHMAGVTAEMVSQIYTDAFQPLNGLVK